MIKHLAIIMDGNRRWAKSRFMPAIFGHKAGFDNVKKVTKLAHDRGIKYLTLWALSTENFQKRSHEEVTNIIKLIHHVPKLIPEFMKQWVKLQTIGDIEKLPKETQEILSSIQNKTKDNAGIILTVALVYGWQDEIVRAAKKIVSQGIDPDSLTGETFREYLDVSILPVPDVIVRTGGDIRHSWFLLYDSAYSEYYFTEKYWPAFNEEQLDKVIEFFESSKRNFWK